MIDSHAHIDFPAFDNDRDQVLARARQQGVSAIVTVGIDLKSSQAALRIAEGYPDIFAAVGFHPNSSSKMRPGDLDRLAELAGNSRVVAIGEIGLDFYRKASPRQRQLEAFQQQLELAAELGLAVIIHCRNAHQEVLETLSRWVKFTKPIACDGQRLGVLHCFSGDVTQAERYLELGFLISLPGSVTYPSARDKVELARQLPLDRLLVETDSPFLAPQAHRGQRNEPSYVPLVVEKIAQSRGVPAEIVGRATAQNAIRLFQLPLA